MKRILFLVMVLSLSWAAFTVTALDVAVDVNEDGSAEITEDLYLLITTDYHISTYTNGLTQNDLASWGSLTGLSDVRYHVDNRIVDVQNVVVRPQPVSKCNPLADLCHGELKISYRVDAYRGKEGQAVNNSGLFLAEEYKPRTTRYTLNSGALSFEESELGDVILGENERLTFLLPEKATLVEVAPLPEGLEKEGLADAKELSWENTVLARFNIVFEKEDSLDTEVLQFFMNARQGINELVSGPEGPALVILILIVVGAYLHLQGKVKKVNK
ncbi:hypothetical protein GF412_01765 [Candidatus Micrarchaeota archaeon]|nr:hypothetical protein [Candidatus Micrarchaeota archaeon]MBD3417689.1 hypothetical protein [Candidatus Micrarchaeota archaeon]